jgi:hypothetical protein
MIDWLNKIKLGFPIHPSTRDLLAWLDGGHEMHKERKIAGHLETCFFCRSKLSGLQRAGEIFSSIERQGEVEATQLSAGRLRLQAAMRNYAEREARKESGFAQTALGRLLIAELAVYLGKHAASAILAKIHYEQPGSREVLIAIEPSLKGLLGSEAAAAVATKIVFLLEPAGGPSLPQSG